MTYSTARCRHCIIASCQLRSLGYTNHITLTLPTQPRRSKDMDLTGSLHKLPEPIKPADDGDDAQNRVGDSNEEIDGEIDEESPETQTSTERLFKLSNLQTRIVEHAMTFPAATRLTYSTCSIHEQENEIVVSRVLASNVAKDRGWKLLPRPEQMLGMKRWKHRGIRSDDHAENVLTPDELDACIRCSPDDGEGTMGFFVCAFTRKQSTSQHEETNANEDDAWEGFD